MSVRQRKIGVLQQSGGTDNIKGAIATYDGDWIVAPDAPYIQHFFKYSLRLRERKVSKYGLVRAGSIVNSFLQYVHGRTDWEVAKFVKQSWWADFVFKRLWNPC